MKMSLTGNLSGKGRQGRSPVLLAITPPRTGERTLLGVENLLGSIAVPEPFSLEMAGDAGGVTLMARCIDGEVVRGQIAVRYPQARIVEVPTEDDPLALREGEQAWEVTLRSGGPAHAPLRIFRDEDLLDAGSDPLMAIIGALSSLNEGERIVSRLLLRSLGPDWADAHRTMPQGASPQQPRTGTAPEQPAGQGAEGLKMAVFGLGALAAMQGYFWVRDGETWKAVLLGLGVVGVLAVGGWAWARWKGSRSRVIDPLLAREKVSRIAFDAEIRVTVILPQGTGPQRATELLEPVAAAYRHYDNPAGARLRVSRMRPVRPDASLHPAGPGLFGSRSILGVREAASLWHPPGAKDETPLVARSGSRVLLPSSRGVGGGAHVGDTTSGKPREIRFPPDLLRRHHLYVARTRMGKSTLMQHIVAHKMREKAEGRDTDAIVVVDPHADLVAGLLEHVPPSLAGSVRLVDLADRTASVGINLLDTRVFDDRDRTADSVVRVARSLWWDQWGPRMQSILEHTVKSLHEANRSRAADEQYTILDGLKMVSDESFKNAVLAEVTDPYILQWWGTVFARWSRDYSADSLAPVQTRLSYYASSKRARAILGQPRSTIDVRRLVQGGGVLLVSTAQGAAGRDVAALIGSSLLNLVDAVIREQGEMPADRRRGALVVIDEMQTMPGVDYESMLSELGKFGASFILATQSLAKLADLSPTMQDTVLANVGCLAVFQVAGSDARRLVWELGTDRVTEDDITSLPVHHCYVRATVGAERMPAFSMMVRKPGAGDPGTAAHIRAATAGYTLPAEALAAARSEMEAKGGAYSAGREALEKEGQASVDGDAPESPPRRDQPSRRNDQGGASPKDGGVQGSGE